MKPDARARAEILADRFELLVFDLDGTLADTHVDLARSVNHALRSLSRAPLSEAEVKRYVGNGARRLLERSLGAQESDPVVDRALRTFLEHYALHCTTRTNLYPGVREALARLDRWPKAVLTNKPIAMARKVLRHLDIERYFPAVVGGDGPAGKKPDPAGLNGILDAFDVPPDRALFVGDSAVDVRTARAAATPVAGVRYGFRPEQLEDHPPDFLWDSLEELLAPVRSGVDVPMDPPPG